ncbi:cytochrome P450 [Nonomuraea angiospora]|uniref:cytochrome P450 n=1 Tax=Nonomuraea angiospora TaxID=46172 RepID=UPI0033E0D72F
MSSDMVLRIAELTTALLDEIDLVEKIAHPLPVMVIAELLGIPIHDRELFRTWADRLVALHVEDPRDIEIGQMVGQAMREMGEYVLTHVRERRTRPRDDLVSRLVAAEVDGDRLTDAEIVNSSCLLLLAGQITSTMALGNAFLRFRDEPGVESAVRADRELIAPAFEEVLRLRPPLTQAARLPTADVEIDGTPIRAGSMVIRLLSANYDERQFPDPYRLAPSRRPNRQYAFGHGIHFCLGAPMARVEGKVALELVFDRFEQVEIDRTRSCRTTRTPCSASRACRYASSGHPMTAPVGATSGPLSVADGGTSLFAWLREMRDTHPTWRDSYGMYHVFRYDDVRAVLAGHGRFSSDRTRLMGRQPFGQGGITMIGCSPCGRWVADARHAVGGRPVRGVRWVGWEPRSRSSGRRCGGQPVKGQRPSPGGPSAPYGEWRPPCPAVPDDPEPAAPDDPEPAALNDPRKQRARAPEIGSPGASPGD